jgi:hypothetical protein
MLLTVHDSKRQKDRTVPLPERVVPGIREQMRESGGFIARTNWRLSGLLLNFGLLFGLHSRIPANEGFPKLVH